MKHLMIVVALGMVTGTAHAQPTQAAWYELSIEGIKADPKASLAIESWSWGAASPQPDPSMPKKQGIQTQDLYLSIEQSDASPLLLEALVAETVLPKVTLKLNNPASKDKSFELVLKDVKVTSYQTSGSGGGYGSGVPNESLSLSFKTAKLTVGTGKTSRSAEVTSPKP
jgi:type VI protein secretion system component Hcp